jgi:hypothetical protein
MVEVEGAPHREGGEPHVYHGPYIAERGGPPAFRWVWVANGSRPQHEVFAPPGPLVQKDDRGWSQAQIDPATIARVIESFRAEAYGLPDDDPWADDEEELDEEPVIDSPPATDSSSASRSSGAEIRVLGSVEVVGWRERPERAVVTELACYLALHRTRPITGEELRMALRPDGDNEPGAKSLRNYMSLLRRALGAELVPSGSAAGYRLSPEVSTDWDRFVALTGPGADISSLRAALELVRGRPFAGIAPKSFGWVFSELLVSEMEVAISSAARRLAEQSVERDDLDTALWATRQGLAGIDRDIGLWELHLSIANRLGPDAYRRARRDAEAALGDDADDLGAATSTIG